MRKDSAMTCRDAASRLSTVQTGTIFVHGHFAFFCALASPAGVDTATDTIAKTRTGATLGQFISLGVDYFPEA